MSRSIGDRRFKCNFAPEDEKKTEWGSVERPYTNTDGLVTARATVSHFSKNDMAKVAHVLAATDGIWDALAGYHDLPDMYNDRLDIQDRLDAANNHMKAESRMDESEDVPFKKFGARPSQEEIKASEERRHDTWIVKLRARMKETVDKQMAELTRLLQLFHHRPSDSAKANGAGAEANAEAKANKSEVSHLPSRLVAHCEQPCFCKPRECSHADNKTVVLASLPTMSPWGMWW